MFPYISHSYNPSSLKRIILMKLKRFYLQIMPKFEKKNPVDYLYAIICAFQRIER